jgi:recombination protein RecA
LFVFGVGRLNQAVWEAPVAQHARDDPQPTDDLAALIATIQRRWGARALRRGAASAASDRLPTTIAPLDHLLGGGVPRGAISELLGAPTAGTTTIALTALAHAQARGEVCAYLDGHGHFGVEYATMCGVDLARLILVRSAAPRDALAIVRTLIEHQVSVLVINTLDVGDTTASDGSLADGMRGLMHALMDSPCALLALTALPDTTLDSDWTGERRSRIGTVAALRLLITREAWQLDDVTTPRCRSRVRVLRQRGAPAGAECQITIRFPLGGVERR